MKTILCFGDSNTHGTIPRADINDLQRYPKAHRWPSVMAEALGPDYDVISEGHGGRNASSDDPIEGKQKNGERALLMLLESHRPIDVLIIMLGTNDLKQRFNLPPIDIANGIERLVKIAKSAECGPARSAPDILVVSPVPIIETGFFAEIFAGGAEKSRALPPYLSAMAERNGAAFLDLAPVADVDPIDGIHLSAESLNKIGRAMAAKVSQMVAGKM